MQLMRQNGHVYLKLSDKGDGFNMPEEINSSFGLSLIHDLSEQIGADIIFTSDSSGTSYELKMEH